MTTSVAPSHPTSEHNFSFIDSTFLRGVVIGTDSGESRIYFDSRAETYESGNWRAAPLFDSEIEAIESVPGGRNLAVDVGSGPGRPLALLQQRARLVVGIDISLQMLALARHAFPKVVGDGGSLPLTDSCADLQYLRMCMHYFDIVKLRNELHRVAAPGCHVIISSIFPYGSGDVAWFNARHILKGKRSAYTPTVTETVKAFQPLFELSEARSWRATNYMSASLKAHSQGNAAKLVDHAKSAPIAIRRLYDIEDLDASQMTLTVQWNALTLVARK